MRLSILAQIKNFFCIGMFFAFISFSMVVISKVIDFADEKMLEVFSLLPSCVVTFLNDIEFIDAINIFIKLVFVFFLLRIVLVRLLQKITSCLSFG